MATFRFVEVRLMEIAAAWTPTTPEMEVKLMLGRHIWDFAQHADALGHRSFELRQSMHHTLRPAEAFARIIEDVASVEGTAERLASLYDEFLPLLAERYERYRLVTDRLLDEPTVVVIERILLDSTRQRREATQLRETLRLPTRPPGALAARAKELATIVAGA